MSLRKLAKRLGITLACLLLILIGYAGWVRYSIIAEDVEFHSEAGIIRGTLVCPRFKENTPGVVLVHGSGATSRKSMMPYAWLFAYKGYAALAYDKRGVGKSDGGVNEWREFSLIDLAADAAAGYNYLCSRKNIDSARVGLFGASQGGWVVSLAANRVDAPEFIIMASASLSTVAEDRLSGVKSQVVHAGFGEAEANEAVRLMKADQHVTRTGAGFDELLQLWQQSEQQAWFSSIEESRKLLEPNHPHRLWERTVLDFDPQPMLVQLDVPVLWIFGDPKLDRFSPVELSVQRVEAAITEGKQYDLLKIDGVGHTLDLENSHFVVNLFQIRLPLVLDIYAWLDKVNSLDTNQTSH